MLKSEVPSFIRNLDRKEIKSFHCYNCLLETELAVEKGYWKKLKKPIWYWYEMCDAESREIKKYLSKYTPRKILEVGCGSGRILRLILSIDYPTKIFAVEKNSEIVKLVLPQFRKCKNVRVINTDILSYLRDTKIKFDLALCMMNTYGNIDDVDVLRIISNHSKNILFTVYDKKYSRLRKEIYISRGHRDFSEAHGTFCFNDNWVRGLRSRSYTKKEIVALCRLTGKKFSIKKISKLLFLVHLH